MGITVHRLASHTKHQAVLKMKAFVAVVASLAASAKAQVLINPYAGVPLAAPAYAGAPLLAPGVIAAPSLSSQFQSQDEFRNVAHGYANINSAKHEQGNALVGVTGSYSYVDANGELQTTNYIADGLGFRVEATNLPVAPEVPAVPEVELPVAPVYTGKAPVFTGKAPVFNLVGPSPVEDTDEVKAAKAEFQAAFDEVASREKRSTPAATEELKVVPAPIAPLGYAGAYAPFGYAGAYAHGAYAHGAYAHGAYAPFAGAYPGYAAYGYGLPATAPVSPVAYTAAPALPAPAPVATVVPSAPAAREAVLTKVQLNPGHAVAYRVD